MSILGEEEITVKEKIITHTKPVAAVPEWLAYILRILT